MVGPPSDLNVSRRFFVSGKLQIRKRKKFPSVDPDGFVI